MPDTTAKLLQKLRASIGSCVVYNGTRCIVVEILQQPLCLVIEAIGPRTVIQENQFGTPQRRASEIFTIPCLYQGELHEELLALGLSLE